MTTMLEWHRDDRADSGDEVEPEGQKGEDQPQFHSDGGERRAGGKADQDRDTDLGFDVGLLEDVVGVVLW